MRVSPCPQGEPTNTSFHVRESSIVNGLAVYPLWEGQIDRT